MKSIWYPEVMSRLHELKSDELPERLKYIHDVPDQLFVWGDMPPDDVPYLAVVGSRKPTDYGKQAVEWLIGNIASQNIVIVSGIAYGIDSLAHRAAVENNGKTIAVLGSGLDKESFYPEAHYQLGQEIAQGYGAVVSEYEPGTPGLKHHFPARNRIISGLSDAVLVVEATEDSGSLITANFALEQNRDVWAVPGSMFSELSKGCNNLIKEGAKPVASPQDIIEEFGLEDTESDTVENLSETQKLILKELSVDSPAHVDQLSSVLKLSSAELSEILLDLELEGLVKQTSPGKYVRNP